MQELVFSNFQIAANDIFRDCHHFVLWHFAALLQQRTQVALLAVLGDDIAVRRLSDDLVAAQDVGMLQLGESLDLAI